MRLLPVLIIMAMCAPNSGCKMFQKKSKVKSLENLASNSKLRQNSCRGTDQDVQNMDIGRINVVYLGTEELETKDAIHTELISAFSALPQLYVDAFGELGGPKGSYIIVTPNVDKICKPSQDYDAISKDVGMSCIATLTRGSVEGYPEIEGIVPIFASNPDVIRHSLVRTIGYIFTQAIAGTMQFTVGNSFANPTDFKILQHRLSVSFFQDILNSPKLLPLSNLKPILGSNVESKIPENVNLYNQGKLNLVFDGLNTSPGLVFTFMDFIVADAIDSDRCSAARLSNEQGERQIVRDAKSSGNLATLRQVTNTRIIFEELFPNTLQVYRAVAKYLDVAARFATAKSPDPRVRARANAPGLSERASSANLSLTDKQATGAAFDLTETPQQKVNRFQRQLDDYRRGIIPLSYKVMNPLSYDNEQKFIASIQSDPEYIQAKIDVIAERDRAKAKAGLPTSGFNANDGVDDKTSAAFQGAVDGYIQGGQNVKNAFGRLNHALGSAGAKAGDFVGTTVAEEGVIKGTKTILKSGGGGAAGAIAHIPDHIAKSVVADVEKMYEDTGKPANGWQIAGAVVENTPLVNNAARTIDNAVSVITERDAKTGRILTSAEQAKIAENQGDVVAAATFDAAVGRVAEGVGEGVGSVVSKSIGVTRSGISMAADSGSKFLGNVGDAAVNEGARRTAELAYRASLSLERVATKVAPTAGHTAETVAEGATVIQTIGTAEVSTGVRVGARALGRHAEEGLVARISSQAADKTAHEAVQGIKSSDGHEAQPGVTPPNSAEH